MKYIKKAFTLIELIVVISIITITTSSWVFYFFDYIKSQEISQKLSQVEDELNFLDKQIKDYKIFDYELNFNLSNTWSKSYITYKNIFDSNKQTLNILNNTWSWLIITTPSSWSWLIKIYKNNKLYINKEIDRTNNFSYDFNEEKKYIISWTLSWEIINDIELNYFSEDNIYPNKNNNLELVAINSKEDKSWNNYSNMQIKNIWWIKKFYNNWTEIIIDEIYLFFQNKWIEKFIKISK